MKDFCTFVFKIKLFIFTGVLFCVHSSQLKAHENKHVVFILACLSGSKDFMSHTVKIQLDTRGGTVHLILCQVIQDVLLFLLIILQPLKAKPHFQASI